MPVTVGGSLGVTFVNGTNTPAASVTATFSPYLTNTNNTLLIQPRVTIIGSVGVQTPLGTFTSAEFNATISTNQQEFNLRTWAIANGWNGTSAATITIGSGVYIWSDNTTNPAMTIDGSWPGGLTLVNNGFIMGKGGRGGNWYSTGTDGTSDAGQNGGPAISTSIPLTINNQNGYIGGGGGGAGAVNFYVGGAGGAGGGEAGQSLATGSGGASDLRNTGNVAGGAIGQVGYAPQERSSAPYGGSGGYAQVGSGGRIMPGTTCAAVTRANDAGVGYQAAAQAGAGGYVSLSIFKGNALGGVSGGGGGYGASGAQSINPTGSSTSFTGTTGTGGGSGNAGTLPTVSGASFTYGSAAGSGGKAINTNSQTITWVGGSASSSRAYGIVG